MKVSLVSCIDLRQKILNKAVEVLPRYGVKSVTMDDLAHRLGMSKKTIYQHFKDKKALVEAVVDEILKADEEKLDLIKEKSIDTLEEVYLSSLMLREMLANMDPSVLFDLKKYYPAAYERFNRHKDERIKTSFEDNLQQGIKEGVFRSEIHVDILSKLKMHVMEWSLDPTIFSPRDFKLIEVQMELFDHFMFGVLSEKGHLLLKIYKEKYNQK